MAAGSSRLPRYGICSKHGVGRQAREMAVREMHGDGHKITVGGSQLHVQEQGVPDGTPVVFLHGGAGTLDDWDSTVEFFRDCRCVLVDTRGHGASALGAQTLSYPRLALDVEVVCHQLGLMSPIIIGHSDGGIAGIHVAARGNLPLRGLVTIAAHGEAPQAHIMREIYDRLTVDRWRQRFPSMVARYESLSPDRNFDRLFAALLSMWRNTEPGNYPGPLARAVRCPALIISGDEDHLVTRDETMALAKAIEHARLGVIPFGSHVPHWDHPERVIPFVRQFVDECVRG